MMDDKQVIDIIAEKDAETARANKLDNLAVEKEIEIQGLKKRLEGLQKYSDIKDKQVHELVSERIALQERLDRIAEIAELQHELAVEGLENDPERWYYKILSIAKGKR